MKRTGQAWLLGLLLAAGGLPAARAGCLAPDTRPSVGLVLSGGGARGAAHVGVLRQLEAMNVPVDCIAGTSMGAIVGGLYASGMSVDEIEQLLDRIDWADALSDQPPREDLSFRRKQDDRSYLIEAEIGFREGRIRLPRGLIQGQKQNTILKAATLPVSGIHDFDRLPIPFRAVATDIETGEGVILSQGNLAAAVQASMSVPGVFAPREIGGRLLVDGGISNNLPVSVARDMGADVIIAVDVSAPLKSRDELTSGIEVASQTVSILIHKAAMAQVALLGPEDILVKPDLGELRSGDFFNVHQAVTAGEAAALALADEIGRLGIGQAGFDRYKADRAAARPGHPVIDNVTVVTDSRLDPEVIERRLRAAPGMPLDEATLEQDISTIYGLDTFEQVDYEIIAEGDTTGLEVRATAKSWGPAFLDFGLNLEEDFEGSSNYNFAARFTRAELNRLGGEWRIDAQLGQRARFFTEFYQPLDTGTRYFIAPQVEFSRANVSVFESDRRTAEYRVSTTGAGLDLGRNLGNSAEFRVGLRRAAGRAVRRIGESGPERSDFDSGGWFTSLSFDTLDNPDFPRTGHIGGVSWQAERESLGAGLNSDVLRLDWLGAKSFGRNTVLGSLRIASALDDELALQDTFTLGGLFQLSGYDTDQLAGRQLGLATLVLYRKLASVGAGALELPLYFGGALEAGNVWQNRDEASFGDLRYGGNLFVGIDTPLGPLYLAIGLSEGGDQAGYFYLGQTFYGVTP